MNRPSDPQGYATAAVPDSRAEGASNPTQAATGNDADAGRSCIGAAPHAASAAQPWQASPPNESQGTRTGLHRATVGLLRAVPTLAILALLLALAVWGHLSGWKLPGLSGTSPNESAADDWCQEHAVPETQCVVCNEDKFPSPPDFGWCMQHGVHHCLLEHPEVAQLDQPPQVDAAERQRVEEALRLRPRPENNQGCKNPGRRIQFASHEAVQKAGIDVEPVARRRVRETIHVPGEVRYDETRVARLSSKAPGTVWRVEKRLGDPVASGELLALIDSAEVGRLKTDLLAALAEERLQELAFQRLKDLSDAGIVAGRQFQETEAALVKARTRVLATRQALINLGLPVDLDALRAADDAQRVEQLQFLGLPEEIADQLDRATTTSNLLPVRSPLEGRVVERSAVAGEVVDTARTLFRVADTSHMWLVLNVPLEEAPLVRLGQRVLFRSDDLTGQVGGQVVWISTEADPRTRTVQVRADLPNGDGRLRSETFGSGHIVLRDDPQAIVVPHSALQWDGSCHVVFVRDGDYFRSASAAAKVFHTRSVRPGARDGPWTEILVGLWPGEVVATTGSDVLKAQLLRNNLGAG
jgi:cobalt-zinc-cadmium efflux system membrane fusion protein